MAASASSAASPVFAAKEASNQHTLSHNPYSSDLFNSYSPQSLSLDSPFNLPGNGFAGLESWDTWATVTDGPSQPLPAISTPLYPASYTHPIESQPSPLQNTLPLISDLDVHEDFFQPNDVPLTHSEDRQSQLPPMSLPASITTSPNPSSTTPSDLAATRSKSTLSKVEKRQLNTMAARRYRQRRVDQLTRLEEELRQVKEERDALKMRVSKLEGETEALRSLVGRGKK
ncbi:bZIP transcription factor [Aspergillus tanneri]|uniref:BZIP domain-containing protein n=1 Tax=Aspergillus tanneri TaxID=1220188 RepID=A0A5M9MT46_9EURO|nr:uncharacterized protein ATNIH1004_007116 [Aspergillus tanneri]KAA8645697.1 hypothetical protein ATNIH1004_007116 [Aspergillus tanneri]